MCQGTRHIALTLYAVAHDHYLVEGEVVFLEHDFHFGLTCEGDVLCDKAHVRDVDFRVLGHVVDGKVTVEVGHGTVARAVHDNTCAHDRLPLLVGYSSPHLTLG